MFGLSVPIVFSNKYRERNNSITFAATLCLFYSLKAGRSQRGPRDPDPRDNPNASARIFGLDPQLV
jgi:hypothetical protein